MGTVPLVSTNLALAYSAYALGVASPGPSNLAVMATAMSDGRRPALIFALGIVSGSTLWGLLASIGLGALMSKYSECLILVKLMGGIYLLWLALKSLLLTLKNLPPSDFEVAGRSDSSLIIFRRGAALHLTNPKAIVVWLSIISLALSTDTQQADALPIVFGCSLIGIVVFGSYALVFSTQVARKIYFQSHRFFNGLLAIIFGVAGFRMLSSRS